MWTIFIVQLVGLISPGPDFFYVSRKAMGDSRRNAIFASLGISLGVGFWALIVIFGLTFLNQKIPAFQSILMIVGGSYLIYNGIKMAQVTQNAKIEDAHKQIKKESAVKEMLNGLMINLSNPKIMVFFSSVLAGYITNLSQFSDILFVVLILMGSAIVYFIMVALLFSHKKIRTFYKKHNRYLDNIAGIIFILFGVRLIYESLYTLVT